MFHLKGSFSCGHQKKRHPSKRGGSFHFGFSAAQCRRATGAEHSSAWSAGFFIIHCLNVALLTGLPVWAIWEDTMSQVQILDWRIFSFIAMRFGLIPLCCADESTKDKSIMSTDWENLQLLMITGSVVVSKLLMRNVFLDCWKMVGHWNRQRMCPSYDNQANLESKDLTSNQWKKTAMPVALDERSIKTMYVVVYLNSTIIYLCVIDRCILILPECKQLVYWVWCRPRTGTEPASDHVFVRK